MANTFQRQAIDGGDVGVWAPIENAQNYLGLALNTAKLYLDGAALKLSPGRIGLDDGSQAGVVYVDAATAISLAGLTASRWARVELSRTGTTPALAITSLAGADPAVLPAAELAAYVGAKGGYYLTSSKRLLGLAWVNAAGACEGVVNFGQGEAYDGYATSDDADDNIYRFEGGKYAETKKTNLQRPLVSVSTTFTVDSNPWDKVVLVTTAASSFAGTIPAASANKGVRVRVVKVDTGAGVCTLGRTGADTFSGATAFPLRKQWDFLDLISNGATWVVLDSLSTLDSAALAASQVQTLAHGLGVRPRKMAGSILNVTADSNWATDDELFVNYDSTSAQDRYFAVGVDATNFVTLTNVAFPIQNKSTGVLVNITLASWKARIRYGI